MNTSNKLTPLKEDMINATMLHNELCRKHLITKQRHSQEKWTLEFTRLRKVATKEQITNALDWYLKNMGQAYIPEILSAASFRTKFSKLQAAMQRAGIAPIVKNSIAATEIADRLVSEYRWLCPQSQVRAVVQMSLDAFIPFHKRANELAAQAEANEESGVDSSDTLLIIEEVIGHFFYPEDFVEGSWLGRLNEKLNRWKEWDRNLMRYVWHIRHPEFQILCWEYTAEFGMDAGIWDQAVEEYFPSEN